MSIFEVKKAIFRLIIIYGISVYGGIAQLVEHLPCKQGVSGSIPLISTKIRLKHFAAAECFNLTLKEVGKPAP